MNDEGSAPLPRHVEDAIKQIATIHRAHHVEATWSERITDRAVSTIGTPTFLAFLMVVALGWMLANAMAGSRAVDALPYAVLEMACSLIGVLFAILILAAQRRDDRLATRREQMTLQVAILAEQKVSKLIELVEELRRDLPNVHNRVDQDANEMTAPADHEKALRTVEESSKPKAAGP